MKREGLFALVAMLALPAVSNAIEVEFQVPVELKNIDGAADYIEVDCAQWFPEARRRNAGRKTRAELKGEFSKSFSGIVTVVQPWPGTIVPTGKYICTLLIRSTANSANRFELMPSAVGTRDVRNIIGDYSEMIRESVESKIGVIKPMPSIPPATRNPLPR